MLADLAVDLLGLLWRDGAFHILLCFACRLGRKIGLRGGRYGSHDASRCDWGADWKVDVEEAGNGCD